MGMRLYDVTATGFGRGKVNMMSNLNKRRTRSECATILAKRRISQFRHAEDGGIIIMSLLFFVTMIIATGLAVDIMRFETARIVNQATMDRAVLAAAGLDQELDPVTVVQDYYTKAGMTPPPPSHILVEEEYVGDAANGGELVSRRVEITSAVESVNLFSNWISLGDHFGEKYEQIKGAGARPPQVEKFTSVATSAALERIQNVEISLVVDISGSMGSNNRLSNLKTASYEFFDTVVDEERTEGITSISIVPYNAAVVTGELLDYLNADGETITVANPPAHPGAIEQYQTEHDYSTCIRFDDDDFDSVVIDETTELERISHFDEGRNSYNEPTMSKRWCNENRSSILVHSTSVDELSDHIRDLTSGGWTGVDNGVKWGAALLDPALRDVVADMIDDNLISDRAENRPNDYAPTETIKVLVVMTDGANTVQRDMKREFKNGPTKVWHSHDAWSDPGPGWPSDPDYRQAPWNTANRVAKYDSGIGRTLGWRDGFFVEMTSRATSQRWYRPGSWSTTNDNRFYNEAYLATQLDAVQQDYIALYKRFAEEDVARFFFRNVDSYEYNRHRYAVEQFESYGSIDDRLSDICEAVRANNVMVFALAFEAPQAGKDAMKDCATLGADGGFYYETNGTGIADAFRSIAGQITQLRLTQ